MLIFIIVTHYIVLSPSCVFCLLEKSDLDGRKSDLGWKKNLIHSKMSFYKMCHNIIPKNFVWFSGTASHFKSVSKLCISLPLFIVKVKNFWKLIGYFILVGISSKIKKIKSNTATSFWKKIASDMYTGVIFGKKE